MTLSKLEQQLLDAPLYNRIEWAKRTFEPFHSDYIVVWEDPNNPDDSVHIMSPDPNWMACAIFGGILPPVERYHELNHDETGKLLNREVLEKETIDPMTEEEAIEYLIQKDIPKYIWDNKTANRPYFKICKREQLPTLRTFRNAWKLGNQNGQD